MTYISKETKAVITIVRDKRATGDALLGTFYCDGFSGHTLENNKEKIKTGRFRAIVRQSQNRKRKVIALHNEDTNREWIQIHNGNYVKDSFGGILVGNGRGHEPSNNKNGAVWSSVQTLKALIAKCDGITNIEIIIKEEGDVSVSEDTVDVDVNKNNNNNNENAVQTAANGNKNEIYIDRVFVIRSALFGAVRVRALSHSGLLLSTKGNHGFYVLEYSKAARTALYPVQVQVITTHHQKSVQEIKIAQRKWTKQLKGAQPKREWTINEARDEMNKQLKNKYAIHNNECCHIAQQLVRKAMGITVENEYDVKNLSQPTQAGLRLFNV